MLIGPPVLAARTIVAAGSALRARPARHRDRASFATSPVSPRSSQWSSPAGWTCGCTSSARRGSAGRSRCVRSFAEHRFVDGGTQSAVVRAGPVMSLLFLNNNLHLSHHARPGVPWYQLPALHERLDGRRRSRPPAPACTRATSTSLAGSPCDRSSLSPCTRDGRRPRRLNSATRSLNKLDKTALHGTSDDRRARRRARPHPCVTRRHRHRRFDRASASGRRREILDEAELDPAYGVVGDTWNIRGSKRTVDGSSHPDMQLNVMNSRVVALIAQDPDRWALAGDQLYVDLDLSEDNLPPGTQLVLGTATIEVTDQPHTGCAKFTGGSGSMRSTGSTPKPAASSACAASTPRSSCPASCAAATRSRSAPPPNRDVAAVSPPPSDPTR